MLLRNFLLPFAICCSLLTDPLAVNAEPPTIPGPHSRSFELEYRAEIAADKIGSGPLDVFIPLAQTDEHQKILSFDVDSEQPGEIGKEERYGNKFWHAHIEHPDGKNFAVAVRYRIKREVFSQSGLEAIATVPFPSLSSDITRYLAPDSRVPTSGRLLDMLRKDLPFDGSTPLARSRAIYNFVVDTMEYKKVGTGWGNGDTYWACSKKYGNCTDFHALLISLARSEGIPTQFEIGFPVPLDRSSGKIEGYHCWAKVYLPKVGWVPVDASEAKKHPELRELFFGTQPADRVKFTSGRDLQLGKDHKSGPLNFFIYPLAEVDGKRVNDVQTEISFRALDGAEGGTKVSMGNIPYSVR